MKPWAIIILLWGLLLPASALPPGVEPRADRLVAEMSQYLGSLQAFSLHAEVSLDESISGMQVELANSTDVFVRRPDGLRVSRQGDKGHQEAFYDGKLLTLFNPDQSFYAQSEAPGGLEPMLDYANAKLGLTMPLADLLFVDAHGGLTRETQAGFYVGESLVDGTRCDHLAFVQNSGVEWQIWIEQGATRFPRKLVIRHPEADGAPRFQAVLSKWNTAPQFAANQFQFEAPAGARKIDFRRTK